MPQTQVDFESITLELVQPPFKVLYNILRDASGRQLSTGCTIPLANPLDEFRRRRSASSYIEQNGSTFSKQSGPPMAIRNTSIGRCEVGIALTPRNSKKGKAPTLLPNRYTNFFFSPFYFALNLCTISIVAET